MRASELTGERFGRLLVVERGPNRGSGVLTKAQWWCRCECGQMTLVPGYSLKSGNTASCGCAKVDAARRNAKKLNFRHGMTGTRVHGIWQSMIQRCSDPSHRSFKDYGGRGICVCDRWKRFENFLADMGEPPAGATLERERVNDGYSPDNCSWIPAALQSHNRRDSFKIEAFGRSLPPAAWARETGLTKATILYRLGRGMHPEEALSTGPRKNGPKQPRFRAPAVAR